MGFVGLSILQHCLHNLLWCRIGLKANVLVPTIVSNGILGTCDCSLNAVYMCLFKIRPLCDITKGTGIH